MRFLGTEVAVLPAVTPAQFPGRSKLARSPTEELQQALREVSGGGTRPATRP